MEHAGRPNHFYPRPPCGGRPSYRSLRRWRLKYFYPRPPCGGRRDGLPDSADDQYFYPRPPCGGRHKDFHLPPDEAKFLSTSPLRGTTLAGFKPFTVNAISIHVPLAGDDAVDSAACTAASVFLSTSPLRGTTRGRTGRKTKFDGFLSTSPLRGTTPYRFRVGIPGLISIHVPLAGDDLVPSIPGNR